MDFSLFSSEEIGIYDMKIGLNFKDEESGIKATLGWLLGSMPKMVELRKSAHLFIVDNFDFYKHFVSLPFIETVGTGIYAKNVNITTYEEVKQFLLKDEYLYCS